jgi:hypothetical protein
LSHTSPLVWMTTHYTAQLMSYIVIAFKLTA